MELESQLPALGKRGLAVAGISYDSNEILKEFSARKRISFPLLSDPDSKVIRAFGLLNETDYKPGSVEFGVPHPGSFVTDAAGVVRSKLFEKAYSERRTAASFLALAGQTPGAAVSEHQTDHFELRAAASNTSAAPGQQLTLVLDFEMKPGRHAYAPGEHSYRPLRLRLEPNPLVTLHEPVLPPSKPYHFKPLDETVPVFEGRFRVTQDLTLAPNRAFAELLRTPDPALELKGALEYQVCSATVCYAPASLPLAFRIQLLQVERERSPEPIRRKPKPPQP